MSDTTNKLYEACERLKQNMGTIPQEKVEAAQYYQNVILPGMADMRKEADILEQLTAKSYWPYPTYSDLLFY